MDNLSQFPSILLTGGSGQVGFELRRALSLLGPVWAPGRSVLDLQDAAALRRAVRHCRPAIIVNPAAFTAVDQAESQAGVAERVNARAPAVLAEEAERLGAMMVQFSTDHVFDGRQPTAYTEDDRPEPLNVYGATKLAGERAVQAVCSRHLVLRTGWVFGLHGGNFVRTMLRLAAERDVLSVVNDQYGAPTPASLLADVTAHLLRQAWRTPTQGFPFGLYHVAARGKTDWHSYASRVIERARAGGLALRVMPGAVRPVSTADYPAAARRPANACLDTTRLRQTFGLHLPDWQQGLEPVLDALLEARP